MSGENLLGIPETKLPVDPAAQKLDDGVDARDVARGYPASSLVWATLAEDALDDGEVIEAYAYARTGYHRSLDRLRANGWKGWGPVPASHEANQPVLKAIAMLALASKAIGDDAEYDRCRQMLSDADPASVAALLDSQEA